VLDVLIRGGTVVDGTGGAGRRADVAIKGDRIADIGTLEGATATRMIDATGRIVAPGFIDTHSHSDFTLLANPEFQSTIRQGVTTEIVGNCGLGVAPVTSASRGRVAARLHEYAWDGGAPWSSVAEHLAAVEGLGLSANTAWFVGHNALRDAAGVVGSDVGDAALADMRRWLDEAMDAGALGMSTGLEFEPGRLAGRDELSALVDVVGRRGGIYASHIRNRDERLQAAVDECLGLVRHGRAGGQVSHLNVRDNTGAAPGAWQAAVDAVERARAAGLDVLADATPMTSGDGVAAAILPPWLMAHGPAAAADALADREVRRRVRGDCDRYWRFIHRGEWDRVRLLSSAEFPDLCGLTFPEIAARRRTDEWDAFFDILAAAGQDLEAVSMVGQLFTEEMSAATVAHPLFLLGADTMTTTVDGPLSRQTRHPLHFAGHVHFLTHHVRERATLTLERAVRKMTSLVADRFGLAGRGRLEAGAFADVVVFDFDRLADVSTVSRPLAYATGVEHVLVNGTAVIADGEHTGTRPGRIHRRSPRSGRAD
jgi:N-acyl-D-amino-acid deacylase